jgi:DNA mismatch repair protein MutL
MRTIHQLPEVLINQIKAGEVVERPASALKELLENAIDSGASSIRAKIEQGGLSLIQVEDDGGGIDLEDLPLAFARHATSKIRVFEDLAKVSTMGFRGEALASLSSISRCKIASKHRGASMGFELEAEEGRVGEPSPSSQTQGTTVSARDLFFYVPARRKFLKSEQTEANHCRDAFCRAAMSRPDIAMSFFKDNKPVFRLQAQTPLERAKALMGPALAGQIAIVNASHGAFSITGFACPLAALPSGRETQMLFVNHRFARDRLLTHAAKEALGQSRGLGREREVGFVLFFNLPTELVDANVHPAKTEVRFRDPRGAHQFVYKALLDALSTLPPPEPMEDPASRSEPLLSHRPREQELDLFGLAAGQSSSFAKVANEAEAFLGPLRSGLCAWDAGDGLWVAPSDALSLVPQALALAREAEEGTLAACELLIPARAEGLLEEQPILAQRSKQLLALGVDIEWSASGSCNILYAPEGFDNCDWQASLRALAKALRANKTDATALALALAQGLPLPEPNDQTLWDAAQAWMNERRLARELPGASQIPLPLGR